METVTILFNNGTSIEAEANGSCYITSKKPNFPEDLTGITITSESGVVHVNNGEVIEAASVDDRYWFTFREITETEEEALQLRADVDYLLAISE